MPFITDNAFDALLNYIVTNGDALYICSQEPANYTEATSTYDLGSKASPTIGSPGDRTPNGRKSTVSAISDGNVTDNGTASHYGIVDNTSELLVAGALSSSQGVTSGNTFTLTSFDIGVPDAS